MKILRTNYEKEEKSALKKSGMRRDSIGHTVVRPDVDIEGTDGVPEWGNVQFSLSFPLPVDSYLNEKGIPVFDKFWDLPDEDTERYKGIFRMKTQAQYDPLPRLIAAKK